MTPLFLYGRGEIVFGPFPATRMKELAADGAILPSDLVWQQGTERRVVAARVKHLFIVPAADSPLPEPLVESTAPAPDQAASPAAEEAAPIHPEVATPVESVAPTARRAQPEEKKKRILNIKGGILMGQDGVEVKFKKKCSVCGYEDPCRSSAKIRIGCTRIAFFCRTCRKGRSVELTGC